MEADEEVSDIGEGEMHTGSDVSEGEEEEEEYETVPTDHWSNLTFSDNHNFRNFSYSKTARNGSVFTNHSLEHSLSYFPDFSTFS